MFLRYLVRVILVLAVIGAGWLLYRTLKEYTVEEIVGAVKAIPASHFAAALGFAACSYFCLACSDWLAVRYAGKPLPFRKTSLASFTSLSIGHNVGMAALSSGAVRYRFYSRWGLTGEDVGKVIVFCGATVGLGLATLGAIGLYLRPDDAMKMTGLGRDGISGVAIACLAFPIAYVVLSAVLRKPLTVRGRHFQFPRPYLALAQVAVGSANFAFVAASLHQMLSAFGDANYLKVAAASITANIAAIVSHVPGGVGVLEATVVHILPGAQSVAAVIAYRVVYYFIPLMIGLPLLIGSEVRFRAEPEPRLQENAQ